MVLQRTRRISSRGENERAVLPARRVADKGRVCLHRQRRRIQRRTFKTGTLHLLLLGTQRPHPVRSLLRRPGLLADRRNAKNDLGEPHLKFRRRVLPRGSAGRRLQPVLQPGAELHQQVERRRRIPRQAFKFERAQAGGGNIRGPAAHEPPRRGFRRERRQLPEGIREADKRDRGVQNHRVGPPGAVHAHFLQHHRLLVQRQHPHRRVRLHVQIDVPAAHGQRGRGGAQDSKNSAHFESVHGVHDDGLGDDFAFDGCFRCGHILQRRLLRGETVQEITPRGGFGNRAGVVQHVRVGIGQGADAHEIHHDDVDTDLADLNHRLQVFAHQRHGHAGTRKTNRQPQGFGAEQLAGLDDRRVLVPDPERHQTPRATGLRREKRDVGGVSRRKRQLCLRVAEELRERVCAQV